MNNYDEIFRETIIYAYTHSPFYKNFYSINDIDVFEIVGLRDYDNIPIIKKEPAFRINAPNHSIFRSPAPAVL